MRFLKLLDFTMHRFAAELAFDRLSKVKLPTAIASEQRFTLNLEWAQAILLRHHLLDSLGLIAEPRRIGCGAVEN